MANTRNSHQTEVSSSPTVKHEDRLRIAALILYMRDHPDETVSLDRCAEMTLMSRRKLTALFKEITGLSVGDYRAMLRMDLSRQLLNDPSVSITGIAKRLGFSSVSSFSAFFKQQAGVSPSSYRRV